MLKFLIFLIPLFVFSQDKKIEIEIFYKQNDTIKVLVSPELKTSFNEFLEDAKHYNLDLYNLHDLYSVIISNVIPYYTGQDSLGLTLMQKDFPNIIFINDKIILSDVITLTLYHEMGHQILQDINHCDGENNCPLLFTSNANNDFNGRKAYIELLYNWEKHKKDFFEYLLIKQTNK